MDKTAALELVGVFQHVGGRAALAGIDLSVASGEWLLLAGPNGAGKSLLTRLILGLDTPSAGTIRLLGQDIQSLDWGAMTRLRARVGAVLQGGSLVASLNVLENLLLPLRGLPGGRDRMAREARLAMTVLQLDGMENHRPRSLSL
ncbi:MAG: ATP-binding cassette domain-containing protein, partial [Bdellovibrio bacteriovorus]